EFRQRPAHRLVNDLVDAAADEHRAALDIDRADRVGEQHDRQDEPGRGFADRRFGDSSYVVCARCEVAQYDGGSAPERNERQHDRCRYDDFDGRRTATRCQHGDSPSITITVTSNSPARLADGLELESTPS